MMISVKKIKRAISFVFWLLILTALAAYIFNFLSAWIEPDYDYDKPHGESVKVFYQQQSSDWLDQIRDRLKFFYWYGE